MGVRLIFFLFYCQEKKKSVLTSIGQVEDTFNLLNNPSQTGPHDVLKVSNVSQETLDCIITF